VTKVSIDVAQRNWRPSPIAGPIALVTTVDSLGRVNVAPKSLINFITVQPLRIFLGCNRGHHTAQNLLLGGECVLNFPDDKLAETVWAAGEFREPGPGELAALGLTAVPAVCVTPPRILECRYHVECRLCDTRWMGDEGIFLLDILAASMDEEASQADDPYAVLRPIFFLEPGTYGVLTGSRRLDAPAQGA